MTQFKLNPLLGTDGYKTSHRQMYNPKTEYVYSNVTTRNVNRMPEQAKKIVIFGAQYVFKYVNDLYNENFFSQPKNVVCGEAKRYLSNYLNCDYDVSHFEALHDLGYLPIRVKGLDEGTIIGENIPCLTIINTDPRFFWITNFLETIISTLYWKMIHSASIAYGFKQIVLKYANETDKENISSVDFQCHDFSFRGMQHLESAITSGLGFITSFKGSDTIPVLQAAKYYYNSNNVAFSVVASEHSVQSSLAETKEIEITDDLGNKTIKIETNELNGVRYLLKTFPSGILSMVSDTFDLWRMCEEYLPILKDEIIARDGKLVIRPDSGNPADVICGLKTKPGTWNKIENNKYYHSNDGFNYLEISRGEYFGVIQLLWDVFGGSTNNQGFKVLSKSIGCIYGDAITLDRCEEILRRLKRNNFASTNILLGTGSFSMAYSTRDSASFAIKATAVQINGVLKEIFKDPITDKGSKKSAKGLLQVYKDINGELKLKDQCTWQEESEGELKVFFENGKFIKETTIDEIRDVINKSIK